MKDLQPSQKKTKISDYFDQPEKSSDEESNDQEQSTSSDVQELKCPKRKVIVDDEEETDDTPAKKKKRSSGSTMQDLGRSQMVLDCGQKVIGTTTCEECNMVYSVDDAKDVKAHEKFHQEWIYRFEIPKEHAPILLNFASKVINDYCVYHLASLAPEKFRNLISKHVKGINKLLGYNDEKDELWSVDKRLLLVICIKDERFVIGGLLVAEKIFKAYTNETRKEVLAVEDVNDWIVGVDRIWVDPSIRKTKVATSLLDAITGHDRVLEFRPRRLRFAFSDPTDDGIILAKRFIQKNYAEVDRFGEEILVY
ncbi:hypothetical protein CAEBREN_17908 [Caenorhabditis brenneri]|uniref:N-acetyltransferase domain-containing protein n=1 Tax=Caenorhabditis brenneri TaxID=135651 RepID=G0NS71_CAEBE|nr:hypothetical protein CAEBREN_17908 [Caenorhabditis brenneri]